jgi:TPR repeat protein
LQAAWAKGCALGALNLGCAFLNAVGVDADPPRAVRLLEAAAELGNADAKYPACVCSRVSAWAMVDARVRDGERPCTESTLYS